MMHMGKAIERFRAEESRQLQAVGYEPHLKKTRFLLLKRPENLTEGQEIKLAELLRYNLRSVRAYLLKEKFQQFWEYGKPGGAGSFFWMSGRARLCTRAWNQ